MSLFEIDWNPSRRDRVIFGIALCLFLVIAGTVSWYNDHAGLARVLWILAAALPAVYFAIPPLQRPLYVGLTVVTFPIGIVVSYVILSVMYFFVFTPIGFVLRTFARDPMQRKWDPAAPSYWQEHQPVRNAARYFRQF